VLVDARYATQNKLKVGDSTTLIGKQWHVVGIIAEGKMARVAVPIATMQDLMSARNMLTQIYVRLDDPANTDMVIRQLKERVPNYHFDRMDDYIAMMGLGRIPGLKVFLAVMVGLGVISGALAVGLSMYMAVLQRTREIGILKSLGASSGFIVAAIEWEAILLGAAGAVIGILLSVAAAWLINTLIPSSLPVIVKPFWWPIAAGIAMAAAALGSLYPSIHAAAQDPIEALAYE
jgi:putative ABC transport system permease protein